MAEQENTGTEAPTPRRREEARRDGQTVQSPDVAAAFALVAGCLFLMWFGGSLGQAFSGSFRTWIRQVPTTDWTDLHTQLGARWMSSQLLSMCGGLMLMLMSVGLLIGFSQVGFVLSFKTMELNWEKLSPIKGWQRIASGESAVRGLLGAAKVSFLMIVATSIVWFRRGELAAGSFSSAGDVLGFGWSLGLNVSLALALVALCLAAVDYFARWMRHETKLKMSREEIKREQKDETGDPAIRAAQRRKQREALKQRSVADVPKATVILTNPTHLAIAIRYEPGRMAAPKVVAKGAGIFAKNIVAIGRKHRIPVFERKPLARALFRDVAVGQEIPVEFFRAVAEILTQIYKAKRHAA